MKPLNIKLLLIILLSISTLSIYAVPAYPYPVKVKQPDGTTLTVILKGDEFHHYQITEDSLLITKGDGGNYNYATLNADGTLQDTRVKANDKGKRSSSERAFISKLPTNLPMQSVNRLMRAKRDVTASSGNRLPAPAKFPTTGSPKSLVILVNFSDLSYVIPDPKTAFSNLLNQQGYSANGGTGSARDYFIDNSMGAFNPEFDVVGPYTLPSAMSTYGANDTKGNDVGAVKMVVDACKAADDAGVDFSQYDTNNDGLVDNVFVYYAGYNEAEWGNKNTIWPHRWAIYPTSMYSDGNYTGTAASVTFDGKRVVDYACTSELKGNTGSNMCGIGTFTHEFGHVIDLVDFYATDGSKHHTLSNWDIMDGGPYLNGGRTPPAYSAHERFYLGWLTPTILVNPQQAILNPLTMSNEAYLISPTNAHNLNGARPSPVEFFLLENRQKSGWDAYLPGHGMLITRIYYNQNDWDYNQPNNNPLQMGVDIIEADNIASSNTLSGDPFPGTTGVESYTPILRSGVVLSDKPLSYIEEKNGVISFYFKGESILPFIKRSGNFAAFPTTVQGTPTEIQTISVGGIRLISDIVLSFSANDHFEMRRAAVPASAWSKTITLSPTESVIEPVDIQVRYNPTTPSYTNTHYNNLVLTSKMATTIEIPLSGKSTRPVYVVPPKANEAKDVIYKSFIANWDAVQDHDRLAAGYYLTVYSLENAPDTTFILKNKWLTTTSDTIYNLISGRDYYYKVKASDKNTTFSYENITGYSGTIKVQALPYPEGKALRAAVNNDAVMVYVPSKDVIVNVYNTKGQRIRSIQAGTDVVEIRDLPRNEVFIIQTENRRTKVVIH